jgi:hypothetical protein
MEEKYDKFEQIREIFSQFLEENKDKLLEMAKNLLIAQKEEVELSGISKYRKSCE